MFLISKLYTKLKLLQQRWQKHRSKQAFLRNRAILNAAKNLQYCIIGQYGATILYDAVRELRHQNSLQEKNQGEC